MFRMCHFKYLIKLVILFYLLLSERTTWITLLLDYIVFFLSPSSLSSSCPLSLALVLSHSLSPLSPPLVAPLYCCILAFRAASFAISPSGNTSLSCSSLLASISASSSPVITRNRFIISSSHSPSGCTLW